MSQYITGSVDVTSGSATVTGLETSWASELLGSGDLFIADGDSVFYFISSVVDDDTLQLTAPYGGTTQAGIAYAIHRDFTPILDIPLLDPTDIESWALYNRFAQIVEAGGLGGGGGGGTLTATQILNSIKTVDGHNSGLDADLLDGLQGSEFATGLWPLGRMAFIGASFGGTLTTTNQNNTVLISALSHSISTGSAWTGTFTLTLNGTVPASLGWVFHNNSGHGQVLSGANLDTPNGTTYTVPNGAAAAFAATSSGKLRLWGLMPVNTTPGWLATTGGTTLDTIIEPSVLVFGNTLLEDGLHADAVSGSTWTRRRVRVLNSVPSSPVSMTFSPASLTRSVEIMVMDTQTGDVVVQPLAPYQWEDGTTSARRLLTGTGRTGTAVLAPIGTASQWRLVGDVVEAKGVPSAFSVGGDLTVTGEYVGLRSSQAGNTLTSHPRVWVGSADDYAALVPDNNTIYFVLN